MIVPPPHASTGALPPDAVSSSPSCAMHSDRVWASVWTRQAVEHPDKRHALVVAAEAAARVSTR